MLILKPGTSDSVVEGFVVHKSMVKGRAVHGRVVKGSAVQYSMPHSTVQSTTKLCVLERAGQTTRNKD